MNLILASTSQFRQQLLTKLGLPFTAIAPEVDEHPLPNETAQQLVVRLSREKAQNVAKHYTNHLIIGSDQVCVIDNHLCGKPLSVEQAINQLTLASGNKVTFYTGLTLLNSQSGNIQYCYDTFNVYFRSLTNNEIRRYIDKEQPLNCAGSFKSEGLGICLFDKLEGDDPNSLIGLPLIKLTAMLITEGINPLLID